jgi:hypothetical protein
VLVGDEWPTLWPGRFIAGVKVTQVPVEWGTEPVWMKCWPYTDTNPDPPAVESLASRHTDFGILTEFRETFGILVGEGSCDARVREPQWLQKIFNLTFSWSKRKQIVFRSQSQSHITTANQSVSLSWCRAASGTHTLHGLSPRANYTDRATTACWRSDCQLFADRGCNVVSVKDSRFSRQEPLLFYKVAPQLYSRGWVGPVPDHPLLFFSW